MVLSIPSGSQIKHTRTEPLCGLRRDELSSLNQRCMMARDGCFKWWAFMWIFKQQCWNTCVMRSSWAGITFVNLYNKMVLYIYHKASKMGILLKLLIFLWYMWEVKALIDFIDEETESQIFGWDHNHYVMEPGFKAQAVWLSAYQHFPFHYAAFSEGWSGQEE